MHDTHTLTSQQRTRNDLWLSRSTCAREMTTYRKTYLSAERIECALCKRKKTKQLQKRRNKEKKRERKRRPVKGIRRDGPEKKRRFVNTKSVQAYGPDVKEWEWAVTGDAAECRSEPGGRAFFGVDTLWNLTDGDCDTCGTWQHIER